MALAQPRPFRMRTMQARSIGRSPRPWWLVPKPHSATVRVRASICARLALSCPRW